jgi:hypothetical protein
MKDPKKIFRENLKAIAKAGEASQEFIDRLMIARGEIPFPPGKSTEVFRAELLLGMLDEVEISCKRD